MPNGDRLLSAEALHAAVETMNEYFSGSVQSCDGLDVLNRVVQHSMAVVLLQPVATNPLAIVSFDDVEEPGHRPSLYRGRQTTEGRTS